MNSLFNEPQISAATVVKELKARSAVKRTEPKQAAFTTDSLFGDDFVLESKATKLKDLKERASGKAVDDTEALLKSKVLTLRERLNIINEKVLKVLGKQKRNVLVIKDKATLNSYIDACIASGIIAIDTETNNSLDPVTCQLMGPCFYYPGGKQAYVPLNHRDPDTKVRLDWQLTEADIKEALQRIIDAKCFVIMHNGKFDYEVLYCTCGIKVKPDWDTIIASRLMDENEKASLKMQYISKIDKTQSKYDIEGLFKGVAYADVDPDIFALYAATDSMMTYELYKWQLPQMTAPEQERLYWVFKNIEMPIVIVTAEMEMRGVTIDQDYAVRLKAKYDKQLVDLDTKIEEKMAVLEPLISAWRLTKEANAPSKTYAPKKSKKSPEKIKAEFTKYDEQAKRWYKDGKPRVAQVESPLSLSSPAQLGILFYDILKCPAVSKKSPRGTGSNELKALEKILGDEAEIKKMISSAVKMFNNEIVNILTDEAIDDKSKKTVKAKQEDDEQDLEAMFEEATEDLFVDEEAEASGKIKTKQSMTAADIKKMYEVALPVAKNLCKAILDRRGLMKLITTYIDVIPELTKHWPDGRIRFHLNSLGTDTGRYSSGGKLKFMENDQAVEISGINIQNIPSHNKDVRMLFCAKPGYKLIGSDYSAQEPRLTAFISQDPKMIQAYVDNKDLYAIIAQSAFDNAYEENLEFWPAGTELEIDGQKVIAGNKTHKNPPGKDRRSVGKVLLLASTYGMSGKTAGERLKKTPEEGEKLLENFFNGFPDVARTIEESKRTLMEKKFVEDPFGRRRHLPIVDAPNYEVSLLNNSADANFNPILGCGNRTTEDPKVTYWKNEVKKAIDASQDAQYKRIMRENATNNTNKAWQPNGEMSNKAYEKLAQTALEDGVLITANTGKKAQAMRQCFNARIQGGAASLTKLAMVAIENDQKMIEWDAHLVITVHDEVIVECPAEYADLVEERLPQIMVDAAKNNGITVPMKCDPYNVIHWYEDEAAAVILDEFKKLLDGNEAKGIAGLPREEAAKAIYAAHPEHLPETIDKVLSGETDQLEF